MSSPVTFYVQQKPLRSVAFVFSKPKHRVPAVLALTPSPETPREDEAQGNRGPVPAVHGLVRYPIPTFPWLTCFSVTGLIQVP